MKLILVLCLTGSLSLVSSGDLLVFPGMMVNRSCDVENKVNAGKCIRYNDCTSETKELCDFFNEVAYVCCENSSIKRDIIELRSSRTRETGRKCIVY